MATRSLWKRCRANGERGSIGVVLAVIVAFAVVAGGALWYVQKRADQGGGASTLSPESKAYVRHLDLSDVEMKASESYLRQTVVEIDGKIANKGDRFVDQLVANCAELALIDTSIAPNPTDVFLLALHRQFPQLQLVVVGPQALQSTLAAQLGEGTPFRFVPSPASPERLKTLLLAALRRRERVLTDAEPALAGPGRRGGRARSRRWVWMLALALIAAAAAAAGWFASAYASRHLLP